VGDVISEEVIQLIEKYFADIPSQSIPQTVSSKETKQNDEKRIKLIHDSEPQLLMGFHKPTLPAHDDYVFDVINSILGNGRSSRLYESIVLEQHIAVQVGTSIGPGSRYPNLFIISGAPRYPYTVEDLERAIEREINKLKTEPVSKRELQKVLNQFEAELIRGMKTNSGLASILVSFETLAGDWRYITDHIEKVKQITPEDIMLTARKYFTEKNETFCFITKKNES
jgi:predicted Zn-dependent peptidase